MHPILKTRRSRINLALSCAIAACFGLLNYCVNFPERIGNFFFTYSHQASMRLILNALFIWLALLLFTACWRWIQAERECSQLEAVISGINPDALLVVRPDRTIVMCNNGVERMFGLSIASVMGSRTDTLYHDRRAHDRESHEVYDALERDGYHIGTATGRRGDGTEFPLEIISGELPNRRGAVLLLRDITDRVRAEERRLEAEKQLRERQHLESLGVLAGGVAHDFNNLLTSILGNAELAVEAGRLHDEDHRWITAVTESAGRAAVICKDLLAYAGKGAFDIQPLDLATEIRGTLPSLEALATPTVKLHAELPESMPPIRADSRQIRHVLLSLVSNAIEAIGLERPGTVRIQANVREVDTSVLSSSHHDGSPQPGQYAQIIVSDDGPGMQPEQLRRIFEPFYTTHFPGRGLGLSAVLGIVRSHGGLIMVESTVNAGAIVSVLFPVRPPRDINIGGEPSA
ncbi:MAG: ATP-binding protein [Verrucomicrobia bacterium]|nr:ATP-binding protein [Verrucomicrobiota bacterium]